MIKALASHDKRTAYLTIQIGYRTAVSGSDRSTGSNSSSDSNCSSDSNL